MDLEQQLTRDLALIAVTSTTGGLVVRRSTSPLVRGVARQAVVWGLVDGAIAAVGIVRRRGRGPTEPHRLRRLLLVNALLDVGYVAGGAALALRPAAVSDRIPCRPPAPAALRGDGLGIVAQGLALLLLDTAYARRLR